MNYNQLYKSVIKFHIGMGAYGFTRGFRSRTENESFPRLVTERISEGLVNSLIYVSPFWNIYPMFCLFNRVEICIRGLKKEDYKIYYREPLSEYCFDTL